MPLRPFVYALRLRTRRPSRGCSIRSAIATVVLASVAASSPLVAQVFFGSSPDAGYYDSGLAFVTAPSVLAQAGPTGDKWPTADKALFGDNSLLLEYTSVEGGDWSALALALGFGEQDLSELERLGFWLAIETPLVTLDEEVFALPDLFLEVGPGNEKTTRLSLAGVEPLATFTTGEMPGFPLTNWTFVSVPLDTFRNDPANADLDFTQVKAVIFGQGEANGVPHRMRIDQIQAYDVPAEPTGEAPAIGSVLAYPRHAELRLEDAPGATSSYVMVYQRSTEAADIYKVLPAGDTLALIWREGGLAGARLQTVPYEYGRSGSLFEGSTAYEVEPSGKTGTDLLLDMTQRSTLRYFWDFAHPVSGLARERNTSPNTVTMGGSGFGLMAWCVGVERGWLERDVVAERLLGTLQFLKQADRFHGVWPHWMDGRTGRVRPFSPRDNGGDIVETAFLAQGLLTVRQYFDGDDATEAAIRELATDLWEGIEWDWHVRPGEDVVTWHWSPDQGFAIDLKVRGFNEAQIVYILGIASPTHGIPGDLYGSGWIRPGYQSFRGRYGIFVRYSTRSGGPMFFAHYSNMGLDPRYWRDGFDNYFARHQRHVDYQVAYAEDNPEGHAGYSREAWGITASDGRDGYTARAAQEDRDDGTLTPTAALASMPYRPGDAQRALEHFYNTYGGRLFGEMGFRDAFNPTQGWFASSYLAIDQGPIVGMIENHRSGLLWDNFMANPEIAPALEAAGFTRDSTTVGASEVLAKAALEVRPNPSSGALEVVLDADEVAGGATITIITALGQVGFRQNTTSARNDLDISGLAAGSYVLRVTTASGQVANELIHLAP